MCGARTAWCGGAQVLALPVASGLWALPWEDQQALLGADRGRYASDGVEYASVEYASGVGVSF